MLALDRATLADMVRGRSVSADRRRSRESCWPENVRRLQ